ncbi:hybrid sensor histidine kinase/response regulator [Ferrimonas marina]|uniref:histidine kinase n=1 Tax=Ferrimonas marina TaxID=299255 RepID=A0A1M5QWZ5_9GAMM|nr:PAS-domain containing protein [Ferrimonas marina]SHH18448.1 hypothetical protein SAMN02745129_1387 [Ferrimonas marina]
MLTEAQLSPGWVALAVAAFLALFFVVAYLAQRFPNWSERPGIYSLCLAVCCTSWAFYGIVGQASQTGWPIAPLYWGTMLMMVLGYPVLVKMARISRQQNVTSVADFLAGRYGRSAPLAGVVTGVCLLGGIPYMALQLRSVGHTFDVLTGSSGAWDTVLGVALLMGGFAVLVGTRKLSATEHNPALLLAVAFSSGFKLLAMLVLGVGLTLMLKQPVGWEALQQQWQQTQPVPMAVVFSQILIGALTLFCLPRQFHVLAVGPQPANGLCSARWQLPLYLILINLFVLPIALWGQTLFAQGSVNADLYALALPLALDAPGLALLAFLGGLAAAAGMLILGSIVLSTMFTNEWVVPWLFRRVGLEDGRFRSLLQRWRQGGIVLLLLLAYLFHRGIGEQETLGGLGMLAFVLLAQLGPLVLLGLYWRGGSAVAAITALICGCLTALLLMPALTPWSVWPWGWGQDWDPVSRAIVLSLSANLVGFWLASWLSPPSPAQSQQAQRFVGNRPEGAGGERRFSVGQLRALVARFVGDASAEALFALPQYAGLKAEQTAPEALVQASVHRLSGVLGAASTRMVMEAARQQESVLASVVDLVDEAQQMLSFNRELLHGAVDTIDQGLAVVNAELELVCWNRQYLKLLDYPEGLIRAGLPVESLLRFNVARGVLTGADPEGLIRRRMAKMRQGHPYQHRHHTRSGRVLQLSGNPMPGGGYVTTYTDVTHAVQQQEELEQRVAARTRELELARHEAELANRSKTRFLAAASHDLMQPFSALTLLTSLMRQQAKGTELAKMADQMSRSLEAVESLLADLVAISRLDARKEAIQPKAFSLDSMLSPLVEEFRLQGQARQVQIHYVPTQAWTYSDAAMLRRAVQNLLANAVRYTPAGGKVLLGVRRRGERLGIQIWDNGPGIPKDKQELVFEEFEQLGQGGEGLGLGLAIVQRISALIACPLQLWSEPGRGTLFELSVPKQQSQHSPEPSRAPRSEEPVTRRLVVVDNDPLVLSALQALLSSWGCDLMLASDGDSLFEQLAAQPHWCPDLLVVDYHLDQGTGTDLIAQLRQAFGQPVPAIVLSADPSESVRQATSELDGVFMRKPVKAPALKRQIRRLSEQPQPVG